MIYSSRRVTLITFPILLLSSGCTTTSGEKPSFLQGLQQVIGGASAIVGSATGNTSLAQSGNEMFTQGLGTASTQSTYTPSTSSSTTATDTQLPQGNGSSDLQAVANRCTQIAERYIPNATQQNHIFLRQACIAYCGYSIIPKPQYLQIYQHAQASALDLCSTQNCYNSTFPIGNQMDKARCTYSAS